MRINPKFRNILMASLLVLCGAEVPPPDPISTLNQEFRDRYRRAMDEALRTTGPLIIVEGDNLVLINGSERDIVRFTPSIYHTLKAIAHLPLSLYVITNYPSQERINPDQRNALERYKSMIHAAREALNGSGLTTVQLRRQRMILDQSMEIIERCLIVDTIDRDRISKFAKMMAPLLLENTADAARVQLDGLHGLVEDWSRRFKGDEWRRLRVVVMGSASARKGNLATRYFAHRFHQDGESSSLVYSEANFDESHALDLLARRIVDDKASEAFFGDEQRLQRDLLDDAAKDYIPTLFHE